MIQDDPLPTGADKPLRITGDPQKVQVSDGKRSVAATVRCLRSSFCVSET